MKHLSLMLVAVFGLSTLGGCIVRSRPQHHHHHHHKHKHKHKQPRAKSCPPGYHWHKGACVRHGRRH